MSEGQKKANSHRIVYSVITVISILLSVILLPIQTDATSVGIIPSDLNLGQVSRGSTVTGTLYLSTTAGSKVTLGASYIQPVANQYFNDHISEYSEEEFSDWIEFPEDSVVVDGSSKFNVNVDGTQTTANKEMKIIINIPKDAEPGYHAGSINFIPVTTPSDGAAVNLFALARPNFVFRVNGEVKRELQIAKIDAARMSAKEANIILTVINTGTNTVSTDMTKSLAKVYNDNNEIRAELKLSEATIAPGETKPVGATWISREGIADGKYKVVATVNYRSGEAQKTDYVTVPSIITTTNVQGKTLEVETEPTEAINIGKTCTMDWTKIIIMALIIALVMFTRDKDATTTKAGSYLTGALALMILGNYLICSFGTATGILIVCMVAGLAYYIKK